MNVDSRTDQFRVEFLLALDASEDVQVTEWEARFLESFLKRPDCKTATFSDNQRRAIDWMVREYAHRLTIKAERGTKNAKIPDSRKGECAWLVRGLTGQERCGLPARRVNALGLELCKAHEQQRNDEILRRKRGARR